MKRDTTPHRSPRGFLGPLAGALLCVGLMAGCSTTKVTAAWADPAYGGGPIQHVMVMGVAKSSGMQRMFEETLAAEFRKAGVKATPGYELLDVEGKPTKEQVQAAIDGQGIDVVITTKRKRVHKEKTYVPGYSYGVSSPYYGYGRMYPYYNRSYTVVNQPGYLKEETVIELETNLYSAADGALIYGAVSDTLNPDDVDELFDDVSAALVKDLKKRGLVK